MFSVIFRISDSVDQALLTRTDLDFDLCACLYQGSDSFKFRRKMEGWWTPPLQDVASRM